MISDLAREQFKQHVLTDYPRESCGLVIADVYHPCLNTADDPTKTFRIDGKQRYALEQQYGAVQSVLHSHPYKLSDSKSFYTEKYNPAWPSVTDQASYLADNVPWGIVATDGEGVSAINWLREDIPLLKRPFAWFTADCYSCVRDWHKANTSIILPNFTRKYQFWKDPVNNTIEHCIATIPFATIVDREKAQIGDVAVMEMGGFNVVNHVGVIVDSNDMLHQFVDKYAITTRWDLWRHKCKYLVRFDKEKAQC
jgi:proteasome lid subunit RPN8/RPN11